MCGGLDRFEKNIIFIQIFFLTDIFIGWWRYSTPLFRPYWQVHKPQNYIPKNDLKTGPTTDLTTHLTSDPTTDTTTDATTNLKNYLTNGLPNDLTTDPITHMRSNPRSDLRSILHFN